MIERHVQTIFCDDIRHEVSNKLSYIGAYSGELYVQSLPVSLPKLCLAIKVITPKEKPLDSLTLRVLKDDEVLQEIVVDEDQLAKAVDSLNSSRDDGQLQRVQMAQFLLVFSPMQLNEPCTLRVRVRVGDEELRGLGLEINQIPQGKDEPPKH